ERRRQDDDRVDDRRAGDAGTRRGAHRRRTPRRRHGSKKTADRPRPPGPRAVRRALGPLEPALFRRTLRPRGERARQGHRRRARRRSRDARNGVPPADRKELARLMALIPLLAMVRKDLQLFLSDRRSVIVSFVVPIAIASFFGSIFSGPGSNSEPARIAIAIIDQDASAISRSIVAGARADKSLKLAMPTEAEARDEVRRGKTA